VRQVTGWLTIIGIGDDGIENLPPKSLAVLRSAGAILGSKRVLSSVDFPDAQMVFWEDGYPDALSWLMARRGQMTAVLASGDPMYFGIGSTLAAKLEPDEYKIIPSQSAFSLAAARLKWPLQDVACISLHGRPIESLVRHLAPSVRILALTSSGRTVQEAAKSLNAAGYGNSALTVLEHLGGSNERIVSFFTKAAECEKFSDLNVLAIECEANPNSAALCSSPGLPDDAFIHDGQLTKREVRAATVAALRPYCGALLWDIGAGCGSVGIEWMRAARGARAIAIEENADRIAMITSNSKTLGVPELRVVEGRAPLALADLPVPDAIFIGGGISIPELFDLAFKALREGGVLAANSVTVEGEARLIAFAKAHGGELSRLAVSRAAPVGEFISFKPMMPVTMLTIRKGAQ
jgi:precorrin-6B C5,15-methyltransferase / cobalt-precorrin-6B C5,C15-methyltransferase